MPKVDGKERNPQDRTNALTLDDLMSVFEFSVGNNRRH